MDIIRQKLECLKIGFIKLNMLKNCRNQIEALNVLKILIEEIEKIIGDKKEDYVYFYKILLDRLELVIKTVYQLFYLDEAKRLVEYLEEKEETILWILYDLLEEDEEKQGDFFIKRVEQTESMIDEYHSRKEKKL